MLPRDIGVSPHRCRTRNVNLPKKVVSRTKHGIHFIIHFLFSQMKDNTLSLFFRAKSFSHHKRPELRQKCRGQVSTVHTLPSLAPINMADKNIQYFESAEICDNEEASKNDQDTASNKCNQCDYASSRVGNLRTHLIMHCGEKSNKCNQCDYASSQASHLKTHLKTHTGEKSNKCKFWSAGLCSDL